MLSSYSYPEMVNHLYHKNDTETFKVVVRSNVVIMLLDPDAPADSAANHANATRSKSTKKENAKIIILPSCTCILSHHLATPLNKNTTLIQTPKLEPQ